MSIRQLLAVLLLLAQVAGCDVDRPVQVPGIGHHAPFVTA